MWEETRRRKGYSFSARLAVVVASLLLPAVAHAYNCGSRQWQTITVALSDNNASHSNNYTLSTHVPNLNGCDLTVNSVVTIVLPGDSSANGITSGTLNGSAIAFDTKAGTNISFHSPLAVAFNQAVVIVLNGVVNPSTTGSKTLLMSASPVLNGSIGQTASFPYTIVVPPTPTNTFTPTLSATPTISSTPTLTPTLSPTLTHTPTSTPTGGPCSGGLATNGCFPGGGSKRTDCGMEWLTRPPPLPSRSGIPKNRLVCYEGDPSCDSDPNLSNKSCSFDVRICINNHDARLSTCTPLNLTGFEVKSPRPARPRDAADTANLATLEGQAGPGGFGVPVKRGTTTITNGQANTNPDQCTPVFPILVPLKTTSTGKIVKLTKSLRIAGTTSVPTKDTDGIKLECRPSTCGDGVMQVNETCDDGNRNNGDGCNQGCQREVPSPTPTLTFTPALPSNTPTETPTPGPPTETPTATATPSLTPTSAPMLLHRTCNFRTGTRAFIQGQTVGAAVNLTGYQSWDFDVADVNGVRALIVPRLGTHFDSAVLPFGVGTLCARLAEDSNGIIDCDGGEPNSDILVEQDHNTSNAPPPGFAQDPECDDSVTNPFFGDASASLESATDVHPGVCNSPVHITQSNPFPAGAMRLTERLFIRLISSGSCPADDAPFDDVAGDIDITGTISTGTAKGVIYNMNNSPATVGTTGTGNGPSICGLTGSGPCTTQVVGIPFGCSNIDANVMNVGKLGFAFTVLDLQTVGDGIATLTIVCQ